MTPRIHHNQLGDVWKAVGKLDHSKLRRAQPLTPEILGIALARLPTPEPPRKAIPQYNAPVNAPRVAKEKPTERRFPARKQFLNDYYTHLLTTSPLLILLEHENMKSVDMNRVRRAIKTVPRPEPIIPAAVGKSKRGQPESIPQHATLQVVHSGILCAIARKVQSESASIADALAGPRAIITAPSLNPPYIGKVLEGIRKAMTASNKDEREKEAKMQIVTVVLDNSTRLTPDQMTEFTKLPDIHGLRSQLVGLLESQGRSLVGVLSAAGGGSLVRTLQGLEQSLGGGEEAAQ